MSVVELKTRPKVVVESVIERLEEVLEKARAGEIQQIAIATVQLDGGVGSSWSEIENFGQIMGSVAGLQYRMNVKMYG